MTLMLGMTLLFGMWTGFMVGFFVAALMAANGRYEE
jgi:gas vesicle protein